MSTSASVLGEPTQAGMILLQAMEEIIGQNGVNMVLNMAGLSELINSNTLSTEKQKTSFEVASRLQETLEQVYGPHGGSGVAVRIGRAGFYYGLRAYGARLRVTESAFRLLPLRTKLERGAAALAELLNQDTPQHVLFQMTDKQFTWEIEGCPLCWNRHTTRPVCHMATGFLQESLYWASGGKIFNVKESRCIACGNPACTFVIDLKPLS